MQSVSTVRNVNVFPCPNLLNNLQCLERMRGGQHFSCRLDMNETDCWKHKYQSELMPVLGEKLFTEDHGMSHETRRLCKQWRLFLKISRFVEWRTLTIHVGYYSSSIQCFRILAMNLIYFESTLCQIYLPRVLIQRNHMVTVKWCRSRVVGLTISRNRTWTSHHCVIPLCITFFQPTAYRNA